MLSLYFCKYIRQMYSDYLARVASKKQNNENGMGDANMDIDTNEENKQGSSMEYDIEMDLKDSKSKTMKTGEKYIIRKLISFKITIPKVDDYINKLEQITVKENSNASNSNNTQMNVGVFNNTLLNNDFNGFNNHNFKGMETNLMNDDQYKTMRGFNDDSQIAYQQNPPSLFQPNIVPMPQMHPMMNYNHQLIAGMQNLNLAGAGNCYWDSNNLMNPAGAVQQMQANTNSNAQQMPMMQNNNVPQMNQSFQQMNMDSMAPQITKSNMQEFIFGQNNQYPLASNQSTSNFSTQPTSNNTLSSINSQMVMASMSHDDMNISPAPMRLPDHVTKFHQRSNSVTPVDYNS